MEKNVNNPHDVFVKGFISNIEHARELLAMVMPEELARQINLQSLKRLPVSFVLHRTPVQCSICPPYTHYRIV